MRRPPWPKSPRSSSWLVDGHNAIFAHPRLQSLQTGGKKAEARRRLEQIYERFCAIFGVKVVIVYDGKGIRGGNPPRTTGRVRVVFSRSPEEADDRILTMAARADRAGKEVVVVTSDRALGERLPSGSVRVDPGEVDRRLLRTARKSGRPIPRGDFQDIEEFFLSHDRPRTPAEQESDSPKPGRKHPPR